METLLELTQIVSEDTDTQITIEASLRALGFTSPSLHIPKVLRFLRDLKPTLLNFKQKFPNLSECIDVLIESDNFLELLSNIRLDISRVQNQEANVHKLCELNVKYWTNPLFKEAHAFFWILYCVEIKNIKVNSYFISNKNNEWIVNYLNNIDRLNDTEIEILAQSSKSFFEHPIRIWATYFSKLISNALLERNTDDINLIIDIVTSLESYDPNLVNVAPAVSDQSLDNTPKASQFLETKGVLLNERQRLLHNINSFHFIEIKKLVKFINDKFLKIDVTEKAATDDYDLFLIALSMVTGRTVEGLLKVPLYSQGQYKANQLDEFFEVEYSEKTCVVFLCIKNKSSFIKLPLLSVINKAFKKIFVGAVNPRRLDGVKLSYILPRQIENREETVESYLAKILPNRSFVQIKLRDSLTKYLYKRTANPAVIKALTTSPILWRERESLSNYLLNIEVSLVDIYKSAVEEMFSDNKTYVHHNIPYKNDDYYEQRNLSDFFKSKIEIAKDGGNLLNIHNAIAHYVLMLLVVATGHRRSTTPFYFPWDINTSENLAFICDKRIVGSEARHVPIPTWLSEQVVEYRLHLVELSNKLKDTLSSLSKAIAIVAAGGEIGQDSKFEFGLFFKIGSNNKPSTISTSELEKYYVNISSLKVNDFRKQIATHFYKNGLSGMQIEALLGHNFNSHVFGSASSWSVNQWANQIRSCQQEYLSKYGWDKFNILDTKIQTKITSQSITPSYLSSTRSYEGRSKSAKMASVRALTVVRSCLKEEWFYPSSTIRERAYLESDYRELKSEAISKLAGDSEAQAKLPFVIKNVIEQLSRHKFTVKSPSVNLIKTECGPVEISASRYTQIANNLRNSFINVLKNQYKTEDIDQLSKIAISLILFDAVLYAAYLQALVLAIAKKEFKKTKDCFLVHIILNNQRNIFDKTIVISPMTSALIVHFLKLIDLTTINNKALEDDELVKKINASITKNIKKLGDGLGLENLSLPIFFKILSAWWQIRLPGAIYSIAIGNHAGPSTDFTSEVQLFSGTQTISIDNSNLLQKLIVKKEVWKSIPAKLSAQIAIKEIEVIFKESAGSFKDKNQKSVTQKQKLKKELTQCMTDQQSTLKQVADLKPIVNLFILFIYHLLNEGGIKKSILKFSTIQNYVSSLKPLIEIFWDDDLYTLDADEYLKRYAKLTNQIQDKNEDDDLDAVDGIDGLIQYFHQFLRETTDAPFCRISHHYEKFPTRTRSTIIPKQALDTAWQIIDQTTFESDYIDQYAKNYLILGAMFGLRRKEAYGITTQSFWENNLDIDVKSNPARNLKSASSKRRIMGLLLEPSQSEHLNMSLAQLKLIDNEYQAPPLLSDPSRINHHYLFRDFENRGSLIKVEQIDAYISTLLRKVTANDEIVPHSMRHTFATRLAHFSIQSPRKIPASTTVENGIGEVDQERLFEAFDGGFHAWPFWVDKIAVLMGHSDVDTLLNTYWHTSSLKLAEFTWDNCPELNVLKDVELAALLGLDRSTIIKFKQSRVANNASLSPINNESIVLSYINKSKIDTLGKTVRPTDNSETITSLINTHKLDKTISRSWMNFDALLTTRLENQLTLEETKDLAKEVYIKDEQFEQFFEAYKMIIADTGMYDFEPDDSELVKMRERHDGVVRGREERWAGIVKLQKLYQSSPDLKQKIQSFCQLWVNRVNAKDPWFTARNEQEFIQIHEVLTEIGGEKEQFEFTITPYFNVANVSSYLQEKDLNENAITETKLRISRGDNNVNTTEIGIRVNQKSGSKLGDGRDAHRLMLLVATMITMNN